MQIEQPRGQLQSEHEKEGKKSITIRTYKQNTKQGYLYDGSGSNSIKKIKVITKR
jgi:hypothetical protein